MGNTQTHTHTHTVTHTQKTYIDKVLQIKVIKVFKNIISPGFSNEEVEKLSRKNEKCYKKKYILLSCSIEHNCQSINVWGEPCQLRNEISPLLSLYKVLCPDLIFISMNLIVFFCPTCLDEASRRRTKNSCSCRMPENWTKNIIFKMSSIEWWTVHTALVKLTALVKELKFVANAIVRWFPQFLKNSTVLL